MMRLQSKKIKMIKNLNMFRARSFVGRIFKSPLKISVSLSIIGVLIAVPIVRASTFQDQINSLSATNAQNKASLNYLQSQATNYQQELNILNSEITGLQQAIQSDQGQEDKLNAQIDQANAQIAQQKLILAADITAIYVNGQMSTLEELASSQNISTFVNSETYRTAVQTKIQNTLKSITLLEQQLSAEKIQIASVLASEQAQNAQLVSSQQKQQTLLSYNQSQQGAYTASIQANNSQISQLQAEQAAAERAAFSGSASATGSSIIYSNLTGQVMCGGGYSFHCGDQQDGWLDQWGEYNRECVSYAAWYEATQGHFVPTFGYMNPPQGNAYQWGGVISATGAASIIDGSTAANNTASLVGDIVYMPIGSLGHVGAVLSDEGNGWIRVGQYNLYDEGMYSEMDLKVTANLSFYQFH